MLREPQTLDMAMRDGVRLRAELYRPAGGGRHPVLVMRQPYGRKIGATVVLAHPAWYAAQGYLALVQGVRGRGDSQGRFRVLEDGAATLALAADLDGGDGRVASYGFSYHGMNQYMALAGAATAGTRAPDAMAIIMAGFDARDHWPYEGGGFPARARPAMGAAHGRRGGQARRRPRHGDEARNRRQSAVGRPPARAPRAA